jgi:hypothetical protein
MVNNDTTGTLPPPNLIFTETRNNPIVSNAGDYYISVVRFQVETPTLPLMIPQAQIGQTDPNKLIYTITLTYTDPTSGNHYEKQTNLTFIPQNLNEPIPSPPIVQQDITSAYYFLNNFQHFILILNNAINQCFDDLEVDVVAGGDTLPTSNAPFMEFDPINCLYTLNGDILGYETSNVNHISIFMNSPLFTLFSSLEAYNFGNSGIVNGKNNQLILRNIRNTNIYTPVAPSPSYYQSYGEYSTSPLWNPVISLSFQAALVPIVPEQQSKPLIFNSDVLFGEGGNNSALSNVLTDLQVFLTKGNEYKPLIQYTPTAEYRMIDLQGNQPIRSIQISCFWKDRFGNLHPFTLASGCNASMKILFRKKTYLTGEKL